MRDGVLPEFRGVEQPEPTLRNFDLSAGPPYKSATNNLRVQGVYEYGDPPKRNAASGEPIAQLHQDFLRQRR